MPSTYRTVTSHSICLSNTAAFHPRDRHYIFNLSYIIVVFANKMKYSVLKMYIHVCLSLTTVKIIQPYRIPRQIPGASSMLLTPAHCLIRQIIIFICNCAILCQQIFSSRGSSAQVLLHSSCPYFFLLQVWLILS